MSVKIKDFDEIAFTLTDSVWHHIQESHPEIDAVEILSTTLSSPDCIVCSNWEPSSRLYYKKAGKYFKVVVVNSEQQTIKTAYTTDNIKSGDIVWKIN